MVVNAFFGAEQGYRKQKKKTLTTNLGWDTSEWSNYYAETLEAKMAVAS